MRRKLVFLALLLTLPLVAVAQTGEKNVCWDCAYCVGGTCYDCVQIICPAGGGN